LEVGQEGGTVDAGEGHRPKVDSSGIWNRPLRNHDSIGVILVSIERVMWRNVVTLVGMILERKIRRRHHRIDDSFWHPWS